MKKDLPSIIIRQSLILPIILINIVVLGYITRNNNFFIDKDSYQFVSSTRSDAYSPTKLGINGDEVRIPFYNRAGYIAVIKTLDSFHFSEKNLSKIVIYSNYIFLSFSSILVFFIIFQITSRKKIAVLGGLIFNFTSINIFVSSIVLNDTLAVFLLVLNIYLIIKSSKVSWQNIFIFGLISILRIEYLISLIPVFFILKPKDRRLLYSIPFIAFGTNLLFLLPYINKEFVNRSFEILRNIKFDFLYLILISLLGIIVLKNFSHKLLKLSASLALLIFAGLLIQGGVDLFFPTFLSLSIPILITTVLLILKAIHPDLFKTKESNFIDFFACNLFLFFIFYKTFYFHHLVVLTPLLSILSILYLDQIKLTKELVIYINRSIYKVYALGVVLVIILSNLFIYKAIFYKYDYDLAQLVLKEMRSFISDSNISKEEVVIASDFPEASYFWLGLSSVDKNKLDSGFDGTKQIVLISFSTDRPKLDRYDIKEEKQYPFRLKYNYYQEKIGFNPQKVTIYILTRKISD